MRLSGDGCNCAIRITRRSVIWSFFPAVAGSPTLFARQLKPAPAQPTFSTDVRVVNVFATVRDKQGKIVRGLSKDDFTLEEDDRPQTIRYFSQQTGLPLTLGLLVDTSMSERRMLGQERDASQTFLEQVLRPEKDKAFLIHFDREVELLQDLTSSRQQLEKALSSITQPQWGGSSRGRGPDDQGTGNSPDSTANGGYGSGRRSGYGRHGGTALYDAVYLASHDLMQKQQGRKALILLTDGEDNGSKVSISEAIETSQRADTLAYSVRIADERPAFNQGFGGPGMGRHGGMGGGGWGRPTGIPNQNRPDGKKILEQISKETGGGYFEVSKKKTVEAIYAEIEEELRNQYSIGYTSDRSTTDEQFRRIQLRTKQKGLIVQARSGYYPAPSS